MSKQTPTPREEYLTGRQAARSGQIIYDGDRFPVNFTRDVQKRVEKLAADWRVPRAEMIRYLVAAALPIIEATPIPKEDNQEGSEK
jgi:hypothetical protein